MAVAPAVEVGPFFLVAIAAWCEAFAGQQTNCVHSKFDRPSAPKQ